MDEIFDVVVIGAGISGLTAAYEIKKVNKDAKLLILEAKGRVGGRTLTCEIDIGNDKKEKFDLGGQWVTYSQPDIMEVLDELGLETYPQYITGKKVLQAGAKNKITTYKSDIPSLGLWNLIKLQLFIWKMERLAKLVPMDDPFSWDMAPKYDAMTMETFARDHLGDQGAIDCIEAGCRACMGTDLSRLSVLFVLAYANSAGGLMKLFLATKNCAQELRVKGGTQQVSEKLADHIGRDKILLNEAVTQIFQDDKVIVTTHSGKTFKSERVIVSVPPNLMTRIKFQPPLSGARQTLMENMPVGHLSKFIITYDKAYWREAGYSGEIVSNGGGKLIDGCSTGPVSVVYDATTDNGVPALVGFIAGKAGVEWQSKTERERKASILLCLNQILGKWATYPTSFTEKIWSEEYYNGGCPVCFGVPGIMYTFHTLLKPHGKIHWCGTETATHWTGYMSGAVQSGRRAASEILKLSGYETQELDRFVQRKPVNDSNPPSPLTIAAVPLLSVAAAVGAILAMRYL